MVCSALTAAQTSQNSPGSAASVDRRWWLAVLPVVTAKRPARSFVANAAGALGRDFAEANRYEWLPQRSGAELGFFRVYPKGWHEVEM